MSDGTSSPVNGRNRFSSCLVLLPAGVAWPATLLPLPVVSYTTVSPSPATIQLHRQYTSLLPCSVGLPRPAVSRRRALWSADFPRPEIPAATARPTCYYDRIEIWESVQVTDSFYIF